MPPPPQNITYTGGDVSKLPSICLEKVDVCCPGSDGGVFFPLGGDTEQWGNKGARAFLYLFFLLWCFLGVAIVADLFMGAIDQITSSTKIKVDKQGKKQVTKVWCVPAAARRARRRRGSRARLGFGTQQLGCAAPRSARQTPFQCNCASCVPASGPQQLRGEGGIGVRAVRRKRHRC